MPISTGGRATASPHASSHIHCLHMPPHLSPFSGCQKVGLTEKAPSLTSALLWLGYKQLILTCGLLNDCWIAKNSKKKNPEHSPPPHGPYTGMCPMQAQVNSQMSSQDKQLPVCQRRKKVSVAGLNMLQITSSTAKPGSC